MNIDWFTFAAQIVNFLILVALLRWFLYDPILNAMRRREERIANRLQEAQEKDEAAERKAREYEEKLSEIDEVREQLLSEARSKAKEEHQRLVKDARHEVDKQRERWWEVFHREQEDLRSELRMQSGTMALRAARRTLAQLADADLEARMCDKFIDRLHHLSQDERDAMLASSTTDQSEDQISFLSAFELPEQQRNKLTQAVHEFLDTEVDVSFEKSEDLICGLELYVNGFSVGWNMKDFLSDLDSRFSERLSGRQIQHQANSHDTPTE